MKYTDSLMKFLESIANMLIVSMLYLLFSLPVFTMIPAGAALYHVTVKVIFGPKEGKGVWKDFYTTFRQNLWEGVILNVICVAAAAVVFIGDYTGIQIYTWNIFGLLYLILGMVITIAFVTALIYIPPVLSRFEADIWTVLRLAFYFASHKLIVNLCLAILLSAMLYFLDFFPLALLIIPALFADLMRPTCEKTMNDFIELNHLEESLKETEEESETEESVSATDLDEKMRRKGK